ncbi:hypothetical protein HS088_TW16G00209 [Tripterygium wilfordii]|uniref:Uncharacterized protein n=1 Tax=Tripterygium wilfordii TaxID=458696 RepID=A0A7J7CIA9_TRIWF|nr:hypothetical protein HS088_TW16G00209 [Tripterygium wilfordii]
MEEHTCFDYLGRRIRADFSDQLISSHAISDSALPFSSTVVVHVHKYSKTNEERRNLGEATAKASLDEKKRQWRDQGLKKLEFLERSLLICCKSSRYGLFDANYCCADFGSLRFIFVFRKKHTENPKKVDNILHRPPLYGCFLSPFPWFFFCFLMQVSLNLLSALLFFTRRTPMTIHDPGQGASVFRIGHEAEEAINYFHKSYLDICRNTCGESLVGLCRSHWSVSVRCCHKCNANWASNCLLLHYICINLKKLGRFCGELRVLFCTLANGLSFTAVVARKRCPFYSTDCVTSYIAA